jgi:hypothetical protein
MFGLPWDFKSKGMLYGGTALVVLISLARVLSVVFAPIGIWMTSRPPEAGLEWLPIAYGVYVSDLATMTGTTKLNVGISLLVTVTLFCVLGVLAVLTALRKPTARILLATACALLLVYHALATFIVSLNMISTSMRNADWIVLYAVLLVIFTRRSLVDLFDADDTNTDRRVLNWRGPRIVARTYRRT